MRTRARRLARIAGSSKFSRGVLLGVLVVGLSFAPESPAGTTGYGSAQPSVDLHVAARIDVGRGPTQVEPGFGSVWVSSTRALTRIDPDTNDVEAVIPLPPSRNIPGLIGMGTDSVWLSVFDQDVVERIDPSTNEIVASIPLHGPFEPLEAGGFVWVPMHLDRGGRVAKIDRATNEVVDIFDVGNARNGLDGAQFMAVAEGDLWTTVFSLYGLARFDLETETRVDVIRTMFPGPGGHLILADGSLWVAGGAAPHASLSWVVRIDPVSGAITKAWPVVFPQGLAAAFGTIWASTWQGRIVGIDPVTERKVLTTDRFGGAIRDLTYAANALWAPVDRAGVVLRFEVA